MTENAETFLVRSAASVSELQLFSRLPFTPIMFCILLFFEVSARAKPRVRAGFFELHDSLEKQLGVNGAFAFFLGKHRSNVEHSYCQKDLQT